MPIYLPSDLNIGGNSLLLQWSEELLVVLHTNSTHRVFCYNQLRWYFFWVPCLWLLSIKYPSWFFKYSAAVPSQAIALGDVYRIVADFFSKILTNHINGSNNFSKYSWESFFHNVQVNVSPEISSVGVLRRLCETFWQKRSHLWQNNWWQLHPSLHILRTWLLARLFLFLNLKRTQRTVILPT